MFAMTTIRFISTCHFHKEGNWIIEFARVAFTTKVLMSMIYTFKLSTLAIIIASMIVMRRNQYLTDPKTKYLAFLSLTAMIAIIVGIFIPIIAMRMIDLRKKGFLTLFFNDIFLLGVLTFLVLHLRETEMKVLVDMGVYKNIDTMTDRELF